MLKLITDIIKLNKYNKNDNEINKTIVKFNGSNNNNQLRNNWFSPASTIILYKGLFFK